MAEALICLRGDSEDIQDHVRSMLANWKVKVYASMEDVFDRLWEVGDDVDLVVSEPPAAFQDELFNAAENWPGLLFVTVSDEVDRTDRVPGNLILLGRGDARSEILSRIDRWEERRGACRIDHGPAD